ncbi:MAG TPA: hypothetical protein VKC34_18040, partial [Blastocatellia bacterium]|nr:hypothetical protein [Blastocatellia bacterium]
DLICRDRRDSNRTDRVIAEEPQQITLPPGASETLLVKSVADFGNVGQAIVAMYGQYRWFIPGVDVQAGRMVKAPIFSYDLATRHAPVPVSCACSSSRGTYSTMTWSREPAASLPAITSHAPRLEYQKVIHTVPLYEIVLADE